MKTKRTQNIMAAALVGALARALAHSPAESSRGL
jgi:hypothetical protein